MIEKQSYYMGNGMDVIDFLSGVYIDDEVNSDFFFCLGNIFKYTGRLGKKDNVISELKKIEQYTLRLNAISKTLKNPKIHFKKGYEYNDFIRTFKIESYMHEFIYMIYSSNINDAINRINTIKKNAALFCL